MLYPQNFLVELMFNKNKLISISIILPLLFGFLSISATALQGSKHDYFPEGSLANQREFNEFVLYKPYPSDAINKIQSYQELQQFFDQKFKEDDLKDYKEVMSPIHRQSMIPILKSILKDEEKLQSIAQKSYRHVTGFIKIVLLEGSPPYGYKFRLHIWWPEKDRDLSMLVVEDKHAHKWDIASHMLYGGFEDQLYEFSPSNKAEQKVYNKFIETINTYPDHFRQLIFDSLNVIEMESCPESIGNSKQFKEQINNKPYFNKHSLQAILSIDQHELDTILKVHQSYATLPNITGEYGLRKLKLETLTKSEVLQIKEGYTYYHPAHIPHRLISSPDELVSTIVLTGPPMKGKEPYLLMRKNNGESIKKVAPKMTVEELKDHLNRFINQLEQSQ